jgi:hypothetical protein
MQKESKSVHLRSRVTPRPVAAPLSLGEQLLDLGGMTRQFGSMMMRSEGVCFGVKDPWLTYYTPRNEGGPEI